MSNLDCPSEHEELMVVLNHYGLCAYGTPHQQVERTLGGLLDLALRHVPPELRKAFAVASPNPSLREAIELCHLAAKLRSWKEELAQEKEPRPVSGRLNLAAKLRSQNLLIEGQEQSEEVLKELLEGQEQSETRPPCEDSGPALDSTKAYLEFKAKDPSPTDLDKLLQERELEISALRERLDKYEPSPKPKKFT